MEFTVLEVPGHTLDHIAFLASQPDHLLFCGDTLFAAGCGRLFEGAPEQMFDSLQKLAALPPAIAVSSAVPAATVTVRPLSAAEYAALPVLARGSALRFLLTRLYDWLNHPPGAFVKPKDPLEYLHKLRFHQGVRDVGSYGLG